MGTIPSYPPATAPLGSELLPMWQNDGQVSMTIAQLAAFVSGVVTGGNAANCLTSESIVGAPAAAVLVNVYKNGSSLAVRNANANDPDRYANGFVTSSAAAGKVMPVTFVGLMPITGISPAGLVYLSDVTNGAISTQIPTETGHIVQCFGPAIPGIGVFFYPPSWIML